MDRRSFLELLASVPVATTLPVTVAVPNPPARLVYETGPGAGVWIDGIETRATRFSATYEQHYVDTMQEGWRHARRQPTYRDLHFTSEIYMHDAERDGPALRALYDAFIQRTRVHLLARSRMHETTVDGLVFISSLTRIEDAREAGRVLFAALG